jgi:hypothetical protein
MTRIRSARRKGLPDKHMTREHYVRCDNTGLRVLSGDVRKQWDGLLVWKEQFDERHPQEFVRGVVDNFAVRDARPESPDFVTLASVTVPFTSTTGASIVLATADAGSLKYLSFVRFRVVEITDALNPTYVVQHSTDNVSWTSVDDTLSRLVLDDVQSGVTTQLPVGRNARYARVLARFNTSVTFEYSAQLDMLGGNAV